MELEFERTSTTDSARLKKEPKALRREKRLFLKEEGAALAWLCEVMMANMMARRVWE